MIERALESSKWISAEPWEATVPCFVSFHQVRGAAQSHHCLFLMELQVVVEFDRFLKKSVDRPIQVMYLCGADLIIRCRYFTSLGPFPVVRWSHDTANNHKQPFFFETYSFHPSRLLLVALVTLSRSDRSSLLRAKNAHFILSTRTQKISRAH